MNAKEVEPQDTRHLQISSSRHGSTFLDIHIFESEHCFANTHFTYTYTFFVLGFLFIYTYMYIYMFVYVYICIYGHVYIKCIFRTYIYMYI